MGRLNDLTGQRFGRLTVLERAENYVSPKGSIEPQWNCICDCGNVIVVRGCHLRNRHTLSCGCWQLKRAADVQKKYNAYYIIGDKVYVKLSNSEKEMVTDRNIWESGAKKYCWALDDSGYAIACIDTRRKTRRFHVYAFPDCPKGMVRDHIDGNKLNNTKENIRFVLPKDNAKNHTTKNAKTGNRVGVFWDQKGKRWIAHICVDGKRIRRRYTSLQDAITARKQAEVKYFGEYRRKEQPEND